MIVHHPGSNEVVMGGIPFTQVKLGQYFKTKTNKGEFIELIRIPEFVAENGMVVNAINDKLNRCFVNNDGDVILLQEREPNGR